MLPTASSEDWLHLLSYKPLLPRIALLASAGSTAHIESRRMQDYGIWKWCQITGKARAQVLQNLIVCRDNLLSELPGVVLRGIQLIYSLQA